MALESAAWHWSSPGSNSPNAESCLTNVLNDPEMLPHPPILTLGSSTALLIKIHVHAPSEHKLDGKHKAGEIHLVHRIDSPASGSTLVVLGVFFD